MEHHDLHFDSLAREQAEELGVPITDGFLDRSKRFLDLLSGSSRVMNLIGPGEIPRLWKRHVLESIVFASFLESGAEVVDVGTGAGFPGFVLAMMGYSVVMVEPRSKRCGFLETAARQCGVDTEVLCSRVEETGPWPDGTVFTSRAVGKPLELLSLLKKTGTERFSLLIRVAEKGLAVPSGAVFHCLPSPPLDRRGFILQYSHPGRN